MNLILCSGECIAATDCNASYKPPQYSAYCERNGFEWACLSGMSCDSSATIDSFQLLTNPRKYCTGAATCPSSLPTPCGDFCCGPQSSCSGGVCLGNCPYPDYSITCDSSAGLQCCLNGASCKNGDCSCPSDLPVVCGARCCASGSSCVDGICSRPAACTNNDYPLQCGNKCCLKNASCYNGNCGCPPDWPQECGETCCASDAVCKNGQCQRISNEGSSPSTKEGFACGSQTCYGSEVCVSTRACIKSVMSSGCDCSAGGTQCVDFESQGIGVTTCGSCSSTYNACCPGTMCVNGQCQSSCP